MRMKQFASDNYSGICPEVLRAIKEANAGHAIPYGEDEWTQKAADGLREVFETDCEVFFVFNGTAANSLAISHCCQSYHSVICGSCGHIETDECGAPEFFSNGAKLLHVNSSGGKLDLVAVEDAITRRVDIHYPRPHVISITQSTECGTVYTVEELGSIRDLALKHGMHIHMDGARFANAVASLGVPPKNITWKVGVDVLCLGNTKNGAAAGEAVIFFDKDLASEFDYRCKQAGQLASKMRFLSAPLCGLLKDDVWLKNARHANAMATRLRSALKEIGIKEFVFPTEANAVFFMMDRAVADSMSEKGWRIYDFIGGAYRLMCAWDTEPEDIENIVGDLKLSLAERAGSSCK
ncbi:MAG: low specificity L-threonine aldolase [Victivallales bacterium]|nr:low specificity L-threonine aldolase [Victivallales bacterium]